MKICFARSSLFGNLLKQRLVRSEIRRYFRGYYRLQRFHSIQKGVKNQFKDLLMKMRVLFPAQKEIGIYVERVKKEVGKERREKMPF